MIDEIFKPEDWGVADKNEWVADQPLAGEATMPALEGRDVVGFSETTADFAVKLAPGKPPSVRQWKDVNNRPVELDPSSNTWKLSQTKPQPSTQERMSKAFDRETAKGNIPQKRTDSAPRAQEEISSNSVKQQTKEIGQRKQEKLTPEQEQREFNKKEYQYENK